MLCGLVVAVVAPGALVAACGDDSAAGDPTGGGGGSVDVALSDIPDGSGLIVDNPAGGKALVVRNGQEVKAYNASCTHMGTIIAAPENGVSTCPNHGSQFNAETGEAVKGPATQPLGKLTATVEGDTIILT
ncbi:MAG: Rieske 2Fe-2S domain-containing protein [Actinophytocola sp.]|uniref:Rieske (2Fe-2S) protein n=1 Tax=Actinophytocola sp. TaxID=1872138 RepID=UPI001323826F|nr:Rieske (2Fe-2S) protein [Actinophytocola sp.]MPZ80430.1 Rieske 2Fe-2S domain-containing protein [Actinophytocola sp.]